MATPIERQRVRHHKTRSGCRTCRIRRIKCDEQRPSCLKCTSTGRRCMGYEISPALLYEGRFQEHRKLCPRFVPHPSNDIPSGLSSMEVQAFRFFRKQTLFFLPGCANTTTWETIAMQLSHTEPALMYAVIAVGSMHQARMTRSTCFTMPDYAPEQFRFAMKHYSRAVTHVQQYIQKVSRKSIEVVLLACLMFICIEALYGSNYLAIRHLQNGLRILYEHLHGPMPKDRNQRRIVLRADPRTTLDLLSEIYVRLEYVAASMFGQERPLVLPSIGRTSVKDPCPVIPHAFQDLNDARLHLDVLTSATFHARGELLQFAKEELRSSTRDVSALDNEQLECLVASNSRFVDVNKKPQLRLHLQAIERSIAAWSSALACIPVNSKPEDCQVRLLLEIQFSELWFTTSTWLDKTERMGDRFNENYSHMLGRIEKYLEWTFQDANYLDTPRVDGPVRTFALNQGVLIPLFGIATRCRDTRVRRRALLILSRLHIQESMVDSGFLAALAKRVVDLEEDVARKINGFSPDRPLTCEDVPEAARFMHANVSSWGDRRDTARLLSCHWAEPEDEELTLREDEFTIGSCRLSGKGSTIPEGAFPQKIPQDM